MTKNKKCANLYEAPIEKKKKEFLPIPKEIQDKKLKKMQNNLIKDVKDEDAAGDFLVAFELLDKFKKDEKFIQKDV